MREPQLAQPTTKNSSSSRFSISTVAIRRHIGTLMLAIAVVVVGIFSLTQLQVDLLPSITYPRIGARLDAPGISPEVAVDEITRPLEQALAATEGVTQIFSSTREGRVRVDLFFEPGSNIDQALNDATAAFNRNRSRLPDTVENARLFKFDPSQLPVYEFALTSPKLSPVELRVFADEELGRELTIVKGVASVDVSGGVSEEVRVNLDMQRLQALGISLSDVLAALSDRNQDISGGRIEGTQNEPLTRTIGQFESATEIANLSFEVNSGNSSNSNPVTNQSRRVYLRDFAEVIDGTEKERITVKLNGENAVKVSIQKQPDANTIEVVDAVKRKIEELRQANVIPIDAVLTSTLDESEFIRASIGNVTNAGLLGTALAAIAVLLFLGSLRQTLIILIAIPMSVLTAMILMGAFGLSLNLFSLGGLALGVGIVVDNSIVMLENIVAGVSAQKSKLNGENGAEINIANGADDSNGNGHAQNNLHHHDRSAAVIAQAEQSSQEVESALVASTSTNLVVVLPFLLIGGFIALLFNELILTISFAVAASIVTAITIVPAFASRLLTLPFASNIDRFWLLQQFNQRFEAATAGYGRTLAKVLQHRLVVLAIAFIVLGGSSFFLAGQLSQEILPPVNTGQARAFIQFPPGTTLATNRQVTKLVDDVILQQPETEFAFTTSGGFLFGSSTSLNTLRSSSTITLTPNTNVAAYIEQVNRQIAKLNLVDIRVRLSPGRVRGLITSNSPTFGSDLDVTLQGSNEEALEQAGRQVMAALDEQVNAARFRPDSDPRQPEVQIKPDWERLEALGLTTEDVGRTIETAISGTVPTQLQRGDRLVDVRVQLDQSRITQNYQLEQIPLFTSNNQLVRVADVAKIDKGQAPGEIQRINQREVFIIIGNLNEGASLSEAIAQTNAAITPLDLPAGVNILPSSVGETNQQLQNSLIILGALAAFLVFVVMAVQYNSLIDPLVIILTIPLALAGGILGLYLTETAIGATVVVGAVLLVGIVVNNAIVLVELANQIRDQQKCDRQTAILIAAPRRLRPILMTTITTVLGLFPLALGIGEGAEFIQPLGVVVFSGLSLATLLTLFIIPCFYTLLHDLLSGSGNQHDHHKQKLARQRSLTKVGK
ncbi:acriflavin resistance protein [Thalassoporum mexicanum PCC 7367]|uniref:efflux RND transporter permease subunit n=1 Tax=Thalassoporum mexicanum TaxID=3457544 RepID=UPI00029FF8B0|nr:efflux RND transporter permease subunit [Pseudanabaena sp. PCC 7367]AFY71617.1 acriflavin resistance protein [Pseudanabaena sp. PCC 7367]